MSILTEEMKQFVQEQRLAYIATVCADGTPNLSPKASTTVWDDDHLILADLRSPQTIKNLQQNASLEVNIVDPISRKGYRFKGKAEVHTEGRLFEEGVAFYRRRQLANPIQAIVLITVEHALPVSSPAYDLGTSELAVRETFFSYYEELNRKRMTPPTPNFPALRLVGYTICPYVQRVRILLEDAKVPYQLDFVDVYEAPPSWLREISPLGKVPVLVAGEEALFESTVILEYLNELEHGHRLASSAVERARQRAWIAYANALHDDMREFFSVREEEKFTSVRHSLIDKLGVLDAKADPRPYWSGDTLSLVDCVYAPVFLLLSTFENIRSWGFFDDRPRLCRWKDALFAHQAVGRAIHPEYSQHMSAFIRRKGSVLGQLITA
jgi:glutathione S-transferase